MMIKKIKDDYAEQDLIEVWDADGKSVRLIPFPLNHKRIFGGKPPKEKKNG